MEPISGFLEEQKRELSKFKRKQKKDYFDFLQNILDNLHNQILKKHFFSFMIRFDIKNSGIQHVKDIKTVGNDNIERFIKDIFIKDKYLSIFKVLFFKLSENQQAQLTLHFTNNDNIETLMFVEPNFFHEAFKHLSHIAIFKALKEESDFFDNSEMQNFIFSKNKTENPLKKQLFEQLKVYDF